MGLKATLLLGINVSKVTTRPSLPGTASVYACSSSVTALIPLSLSDCPGLMINYVVTIEHKH